MGQPVNIVTYQNTTSQAITDANEHVVATLTIPEVPDPETTVSIEATLGILEGTNGTAVTLKIRRNSVSGTQVGGSMVYTLAAAAYAAVSIAADDVPGDVAQAVYVVTQLQTGCTAAGAVQPAYAMAVIH